MLQATESYITNNTKLHGFIFRKTTVLIVTAVRTSDVGHYYKLIKECCFLGSMSKLKIFLGKETIKPAPNLHFNLVEARLHKSLIVVISYS